MERIFALQRDHQWKMKATTAGERKARLQKLKSAVEAHAGDIVAAVQKDTRKPENEIRITEIANVIANIERNINNLDEWMKPIEVVPSMNEHDKARIVFEARGVCLILGPWNFPLGLVLGPLAAAVAAGNCCIVKLSDLCPATAKVAAGIISEAFDENEVALFEGDVDVATALLELPFNHIFFTGSTRVGRLVMAAAAKHLATVTLELGGKSPVVVDAGADVQKIAADLAAAKQFNGGQACICPDYVLIDKKQKERLIQEFGARVKQNLYTEDGHIKKENISQIVNPQNFSRVKRLFDDALAKGARVAVGGVLEEADRTIHPTLLTDVTPDMLIMQEEIFAPIVPVMTCDSIDDAIAYIEKRDKPLALYVYSNNQDNIDKVLSRTSSGGVTVNGVFSHYLENRLPFGGVNQSGMGSYHGHFGFKTFSHERAIYMHPSK
ncbi:MAG: aldehyde dehydrogenase family protein [Gammaproteobacteria bacterium]|nr:aldehyde dehydrogenase family protein [Gammaproteobacteria bacterium]MDH5240978.1 aldehyde dehydrogenase family protein [Gammaproteobacteria bacterium]MDH5308819.1 aldehyde dehydrogenase family protein [Gammaproteobacteria bacterium]